MTIGAIAPLFYLKIEKRVLADWEEQELLVKGVLNYSVNCIKNDHIFGGC